MVSQRGSSLLKNVYFDDFELFGVLHLRSDFDMLIQNDEINRSFSSS
jgi:hypothetical protein